MFIGLSHNGEKSNKSHTVFLGVRIWSYTPTGDPDPISTSYHDNQDGNEEKHQLRVQELEALDDKRL